MRFNPQAMDFKPKPKKQTVSETSIPSAEEQAIVQVNQNSEDTSRAGSHDAGAVQHSVINGDSQSEPVQVSQRMITALDFSSLTLGNNETAFPETVPQTFENASYGATHSRSNQLEPQVDDDDETSDSWIHPDGPETESFDQQQPSWSHNPYHQANVPPIGPWTPPNFVHNFFNQYQHLHSHTIVFPRCPGIVTNHTRAVSTLIEFETYFGASVLNLRAWQDICHTCGLANHELPNSIGRCKAYLRTVHFNIFDLVEARREGKIVLPQFDNVIDLRRYSEACGKICPAAVDKERGEGMENPLWAYLLRKWF